MQHWGWPSKTEAPNVRVAAARAAQTVGYLERGKYSPTTCDLVVADHRQPGKLPCPR
jgi:hypothetical protein